MPTPRPIQRAIEALQAGRPVVLIDDVGRDPLGVIVQAAQHVSDADVTFATLHARGVICVAISDELAERLQLADMPGQRGGAGGSRHLVSIEARRGVSTGISAHDRGETLRTVAAEDPRAGDLVSPGHIFPVVPRPAGVIARPAEAEGALDLVRLAGCRPAAAFCHILGDDGSLLGRQELYAFAHRHGLVAVGLGELVRWRVEREFFVQLVSEGRLQTGHGQFRVLLYQSELDGMTHPVLVHGELRPNEPVLARVHSQCLTGDVFHSWRCDCGDQLDGALQRIGQEQGGILVYLRQEGRGIGLVNKLRAYALQDRGKDTVDANLELGFEADQRSYVAAAQIFKDLGIRRLRLITNNSRKIAEMESLGLEVVERVALPVAPRAENLSYLQTKKSRMGHLLDL